MKVTTYLNGNPIKWDAENQEWNYNDGQSIDKIFPCPKCDKMQKNGHDACIANLPGVEFACCGHGVERGYVKFTNGVVIRFETNDIEFM